MSFIGKLAASAIKSKPSCSVVIAAAGSSERMGGTDKLFAELDGVPVLARTMLAFEKSPVISEIVVSAREDSLERVAELCQEYGITKMSSVVPGGKDRLESVYLGVMATDRNAKLVAVHDGARPLVSAGLIEKTVRAAEKNSAALPMTPMTETVKRVKNGRVESTVERSEIFAAQTPQIFVSELLKGALQNASDKAITVTDDAQAAELIGIKAAVVEGERTNIKITTPEDMLVAQAFLGGMKNEDRTGI